MINVRGDMLHKLDFIIADEQKTMKLIVWEHVVTLEVGQSYILSDISVRTFNDEKYVTTKYSSIKAIPPITTYFTDQEMLSFGQNIEVNVIGVSIAQYKSCIMCNTKIQISHLTNATVIKCPKCKMSTLKRVIQDSSVSKLVVRQINTSTMSTYTSLKSL